MGKLLQMESRLKVQLKTLKKDRLDTANELKAVDSASSAVNAALDSGVSAASEPPVTTASAMPDSIISLAAPMASAPPEQADTMPWQGPSSL